MNELSCVMAKRRGQRVSCVCTVVQGCPTVGDWCPDYPSGSVELQVLEEVTSLLSAAAPLDCVTPFLIVDLKQELTMAPHCG